jgi:hypothetical protein
MNLRCGLGVVPLLLGACHASLLRVDEPALRHVAPTDLAKVEAREGKEVVEAREQLRKADVELEAARRAVAGEAEEHRAAENTVRVARDKVSSAKRGTDARAVDQAELDAVVAEEGERVQRAKAAWLDAQLAWRERYREAAEKRLTAAEANRELARAELVARGAAVSEAFDLAPYRGQQGRLHAEWSAATARVAAAHNAVDVQASGLAAAKRRYETAHNVVLPAPVIIPQAKPGETVIIQDVNRPGGTTTTTQAAPGTTK